MPSLSDAQNQLSYEMAVYREQINMLKRETERVSLTALDLSNALKTVESLEKNNSLVPIGGGVLIKAHISETKVLLPVGGGYLIETSKEGATIELNKRIDSTRKAVEKLNDEFNKISMKLREVSNQLQDVRVQSQIDKTAESNIRDDYL
ncbi:MAG: prefoldin subunit alpha [Candidatus Bilamarchaeum sp.]|jgi:prefoldin alpha subunit